MKKIIGITAQIMAVLGALSCLLQFTAGIWLFNEILKIMGLNFGSAGFSIGQNILAVISSASIIYVVVKSLNSYE